MSFAIIAMLSIIMERPSHLHIPFPLFFFKYVIYLFVVLGVIIIIIFFFFCLFIRMDVSIFVPWASFLLLV